VRRGRGNTPSGKPGRKLKQVGIRKRQGGNENVSALLHRKNMIKLGSNTTKSYKIVNPNTLPAWIMQFGFIIVWSGCHERIWQKPVKSMICRQQAREFYSENEKWENYRL